MEGSNGGMLMPLLFLAITVILIAAVWKVFAKAGKPGWASIIPIYNVIVLLEITGRPVWWLLLMLVPLVNIVVVMVLTIDLAKAYGKGTGFGLGLFFFGFIFYPVLGFGSAEYGGAPAR